MPTRPDYVVRRPAIPYQAEIGYPVLHEPAPFGCLPNLSDPGVMLWAMPRTAQLDGLDELLDQQLSVVSRGQLLALGMTDNVMQYRVRRGGPWQALLPGVYLGVSGTPSLRQKEMAALLYAGPGSLITGPVALLHHSIRSEPNLDLIDVLVPIERQRSSAGFARLHRTARMPVRRSHRAGRCA